MRHKSSKSDSPGRRHFRIQSEFGHARQWRSRKNRPCDACRKRKSACVIDDRPPCLFCRGRGLTCQSVGEPHRVRHSSRQRIDHAEECLDSPDPPAESSPSGGQAPTMQTSPRDAEREQPPVSSGTSIEGSFLSAPVASARTKSISSSEIPPLEPPIHTHEDGTGRTAHLMGLSAEQDTHLLASLRSFVMNEINGVDGRIVQVYSGDAPAGKPPIHFCILTDCFMPWDNQIREESSRTIEAKVAPYGPDLVRLYFKHVHPVYCVVSKVRFLRAYKNDKLSIPASLRGAVYGMAAVFWKQDAKLSSVHCPFQQYELFHAAQASLERELDAPNLWKLQACLLMMHEESASNYTFQTPRTWTLSAQAVACAQMAGLHRDPSDWNIAPWEKSLRKKLWWATYMTDAWSSVSHGNPPHIYPGSYTTSNPDMDDLRFDEDVPDDLEDMVDVESASFDVSTAARFTQLVGLTQILHNLLDIAFTDQSYRAAMLDSADHEVKLLKLQRDLECWHSLLPQCVTMEYASEAHGFRNNASLHLAYFATQVLLFRALMTPASMAAKRNPHSSLRRFFGKAVEQLNGALGFMSEITPETLRAFWGRHARTQLILVGNFLELLFLLSVTSDEVCATFGHLERFHDSLQRIRELADKNTMALIRPVALRIDTFFIRAAQMMREGTAIGTYADGIILDSTP